MAGELKQLFDEQLPSLVIDKSFYNNFISWYQDILTRNDQHVEFFGSVLLGVYSIKFTGNDFNYFWDVLLEADRDEVKSALHQLSVIDKKNKVISDETNCAFIYLMHKVGASKLSEKEKKSLITKLLFILQFKFITSRHYNDWKHLANKERALATYNALSNQFKLKHHNSWFEYLTARSMEMYLGGERRKDFLYYINKFDDDIKLLQVISGVSSNIGKVLNRWNKVFYDVKLNERQISMASSLSEGEDGLMLKDMSGLAQYRLYLESNIGIKSTFVKSDLVETISKVARVSKHDFKAVLEYITTHYGKDDDTTKYMDSTLFYGLSRLADERKNLKDINGAYKFLVNAFGSSRSTSLTLERLRERGMKMLGASNVFRNVKNSHVTVISTYVVIWVLLSK